MSEHQPTREVLHEGSWLRFVRHRGWEFVEHRAVRGVVVIVAVTEKNELLLVEQERIPVGGPVIELPAGLVGDGAARSGEEFSDAAKRELLEETGYSAARVQPLFSGPMSPARSTDQYSFFRAEEVRRQNDGGGDATEDIRVHAVPLSGIHEWLRAQRRAGLIIDPKIYIALYFLQNPDAG